MSSKAARRELREARRALEELAGMERKAGIEDETNAYWAANERVIEAEKRVSWLYRSVSWWWQ
jgi:hypothetical protein